MKVIVVMVIAGIHARAFTQILGEPTANLESGPVGFCIAASLPRVDGSNVKDEHDGHDRHDGYDGYDK